MRSRLLIGVLSVGCVLTVGLGVSFFHPAVADAQQTGEQKQNPPPDRTTPISAAMSDREREHARMFAQYKTSVRIIDAGTSVHRNSTPYRGFGSRVPKQPFEALQALKCRSEAVFEGQVIGAKSLPIEDGTFLFTDYQVQVLRVFRALDAGGAEFPRNGQVITLTRPGGRLSIDGKEVAATHDLFPLLKRTQTYFFFAKHIKASGAFHSTDWNSTFERTGDLVGPLVRDREAWDRDIESGMAAEMFRNILTPALCGGKSLQ
jgi:hypothetical protein